MAETKKRTRKAAVVESNLITVDANRLREALRHTFEGVTMLFDCIGLKVPVGETIPEQEEGAGETNLKVLPDFIPSEEPAPVPAEVSEPVSTVEQREELDAAPVETTPADQKQAAPPADPSPSASTVTQDDITRIIVRKIKQDRSNNEKIGAILKTYGVAKVSDLPAAKYEAFLTDLSQI